MDEESKEEQFAHDMTNKLMCMDGKIKKIKMMVDGSSLVEVKKLEKNCEEASQKLALFKQYLCTNGLSS